MNTQTLEKTLLEAPIVEVESILQKRKELESEVQNRVNAWFGSNGAVQHRDGASDGASDTNGDSPHPKRHMKQSVRDRISRTMKRLHAERKANKGQKGSGAALKAA